jgi:shikimate 5-dehydrogenase
MTDRYAVIGNPLSHTKSQMFHSAFASGQRQDMAYTALEAPRDGFDAAVERSRAAAGRGTNLTAPFKLAGFAKGADQPSHARPAGAANAVQFEGDRIRVKNSTMSALPATFRTTRVFRSRAGACRCSFDDRFFFNIIERRKGDSGYGGRDAPVCLAALAQWQSGQDKPNS